ncbi:FGGY-family carbohydrate kinase [Clostridium intestinale]|uniref:FGGY-family carbohydrate kinase n=1 Tax=Clostridium intestinale TaxID=36845 RepID=UPI002DD63EE0|nr:FGGY-family carbohydrate kinase [Clostridium intestinale]WRY50962.1 carbohydrate kinase [Clostridium intestinale]
MSKYLMGIDAGCTSTKAVIFDEFGNEITSSSTLSTRVKPRGKGFEEFDVDALWRSTSKCIKEAVEKAKIDPKDITGIGVCSFGNGIVVLDKEGNAAAPGAFSHDYRANDIIDMYKKKGSYDKINEIIKGTLFAGEPGPLLCWFKKYEPEVYNKIGAVLMFKDLIMYRLTDVFATDANVFGGSSMMDLGKLEYSKELLDLYEIPEMYDKLPKLAIESSEIVGRVTKEASQLTGLAEGTPVVGGMMDILACLVGAGATAPGVITAIAGTWCINETHSENIIPGASANMPFLTRGKYLNCSFTGASGVNYEWFNRALGGTATLEANNRGVSPYKVLDELIDLVPVGKTQVIYHPFVAQPSVHENARANFFNIDQNTSYAEIAYSIVEGVAFMHRQHINFLKNSGCEAKVIRLTGGVARSKVWARVFADVLELPIEVVDCEEVGALGVAITAGVGAGLYDSYEDAFKKAVRIRKPFMPNIDTFDIYGKRFREWERLIEIMKIYWNEKSDI